MSGTRDAENSYCLLDMPGGSKLEVDNLQGNPAHLSRLYSLGILPGTELELCSPSEGKGSVCVRVKQCSLVLGEDMAGCIRCFPAGDKRCRGSLCGRGHGRLHDHGCLRADKRRPGNS